MFIPIGDDNSRVRTTPFVVWAIFGINCSIWFLQLKLGDAFTYGFSAVPFELTNGVDLTTPVTITINRQSVDVPHFAGPSLIYLTIFSSMFMHGSWVHIIGNMAYLLIFGDQVEDELGHGKFLFFYILCGVAASAAHIILDPASKIPILGASGAIAGLLGAYLVKHPNNPVKVLVFRYVTHFPAWIVLGGWFALQFLSQSSLTAGEHSGVAYMAHIGGFVAGVVLIFLIPKKRR